MDNNINIAFIQETFLKREDKWGIKGYSIKRANSNFRKGVAIIISENLKCKKQVIEVDNDNGRYIKVKLFDKMTNKQITISSIYLEPNGSAITLGSSLDSEIIMGDFNDSKEIFGLIKIDKIYQYKGNIKNITKVQIKNLQISDNPYIIGEINVPIKKEDIDKKVNIIDKTIAVRNKERLNQLFIDKDNDGDLIMEEQMENPNRCITIKDKTFIAESNELIENYNEIKKEWRERFLLKRRKNLKV